MATERGRILIVDDSATQRLEVRDILERGGYRTAEARDGTEALAAVAAEAPLLVVSDVLMPGMDGFELCRRIRSLPDASWIPVLLLTSLSHPDDILRAMECGVNGFLVKPCAEDVLMARVQDMILNMELRREGGAELSIRIHSRGRRHVISADRLQMVDLLLSSYENAGARLDRVARALRAAAERIEAAAACLPDGKDGVLRAEAQALRALADGAEGGGA